MLDINEIVASIRIELGLGTSVPTKMTNEQMMEIIQLITLKTWSQYFKNTVQLRYVKLERENKYRASSGMGPRGMWRIPRKILNDSLDSGMKILGIKEISRSIIDETGQDGYSAIIAMDGYTGSSFGGASTIFSGTSGGMMGAAMHLRNRNLYNRDYHCKWRSPNLLEFVDKRIDPSVMPFDFEVWTGHAKNLTTIDAGYFLEFKKLAMLDIKRILWTNEISQMQNLNTGVGEISLPDWGGAESEYKELLEKYEEDTILDELYIKGIG